jgi:hypothetical protein
MVMSTYDRKKQKCSKSMKNATGMALPCVQGVYRVADRRNLPNLNDASTHALRLLL